MQMTKIVKIARFLTFTIGIIGGFHLNNLVHAYDFQPTIGTCYLFDANQLITKQQCTTTGGGGAGGYYVEYSIGDKSYGYETSWKYEEASDDYYLETFYREESLNTDGETYSFTYTPSTEYYRDANSLKPIVEKNITNNRNVLTCYKTASKQIDLCYQ